MRSQVGWCCLIGWSCWIVGCDRSAEVNRYQVPTEAVPATAAVNTAPASSTQQRMLAAIVPVDGQVWFFKAMGPVAQVEPIAAEFQQFLKTVSFVSPEQPKWTLPEGWTEQPGNQFRYATLMAQGIEVTVSNLAAPGGNATPDYILANINRWRDQLQLSPIHADQMEQAAQSTQIAKRTAYLVDIAGLASATSPMMRGPFQSPGSSAAAVPSTRGSAASGGTASAGGLTYTKPDSWQEGRGVRFVWHLLSSMRMAERRRSR